MGKNSWAVLIIAASLLAEASATIAGPMSPGGTNAGVSAGQTADPAAQKSTGTPKGTPSSKQRRVAAGEAYARRLLALMDTDKNGKVSKKEFMTFMEAEFDRLDTNHDGQLEVKELARTRVKPYAGK
jgi:EF-hand domain pair